MASSAEDTGPGAHSAPAGEIEKLFEALCLEPPAFAHDAVARAVADRELGCAAARAMLRRALNTRARGEADGLGFGPIYALYIIGYHRDDAARGLLAEAARLPQPMLDALFGDAVTETFGPALWAVSGEATEHLFEIVKDESLGPYARWAACDALELAVLHGVIGREELLDFFLELLEREVGTAEAAGLAAAGDCEALAFLTWAVGDLALHGEDDARLEWVDRAAPFLEDFDHFEDWRDDLPSSEERAMGRLSEHLGSRSLDPRTLSQWYAFETRRASRVTAAERRQGEKRDRAKQKSKRKQAKKARKRNRRR